MQIFKPTKKTLVKSLVSRGCFAIIPTSTNGCIGNAFSSYSGREFETQSCYFLYCSNNALKRDWHPGPIERRWQSQNSGRERKKEVQHSTCFLFRETGMGDPASRAYIKRTRAKKKSNNAHISFKIEAGIGDPATWTCTAAASSNVKRTKQRTRAKKIVQQRLRHRGPSSQTIHGALSSNVIKVKTARARPTIEVHHYTFLLKRGRHRDPAAGLNGCGIEQRYQVHNTMARSSIKSPSYTCFI